MLNRARLLHQITNVKQLLFNNGVDLSLLYSLWMDIVHDQPSYYSLAASTITIPYFESCCTATHKVKPLAHYTVMSTDGSQIYSDRHFSLSCYLINIGIVTIHYGSKNRPVEFDSQPYLFTPQSDALYNDQSVSMINAQRQALEFEIGFMIANDMKKLSDEQLLLLFDGSLIFWHLENKELQDYFFPHYLHWFTRLAEQKIINASYISMPKSRELISILRAYMQIHHIQELEYINLLLDTTLLNIYLQPYERTGVFKSINFITQSYDQFVAPYFFYMNVGEEIGRIEIPAWIACDEQYVDYVASVILDQCTKGRGYPVILAEAHEQAVIKGPDRDFFYQLLTKLSIEQKQQIKISPKSMKKRGMNI